MTIKFKRLTETAKIPTRAHPTDSGMDLYSDVDCVIPARYYGTVDTGIAAVIPEGHELQVRPRSGLSSRGVIAAFGTVDEAYRGEIKVVLYAHQMMGVHIYRGDRIAQLVLVPVVRPEIEEVTGEIDTDTERGTDGFGSTGA